MSQRPNSTTRLTWGSRLGCCTHVMAMSRGRFEGFKGQCAKIIFEFEILIIGELGIYCTRQRFPRLPCYAISSDPLMLCSSQWCSNVVNKREECCLKLYSMLMRRLSGTVAFGTTMLRMPFFKEALTASWSTLAWKVKLRSNRPTLRSETQYCDFGASVLACS